jgi:putative transposase
VVMDEAHLITASRYVALNPVRAGLVTRAEDWPWSSVRAHLARRDDELVTVRPLLDRIEHFGDAIKPTYESDATFDLLRRSETTGRPLGGVDFMETLETRLDRRLTPRRRGRKPIGMSEPSAAFTHEFGDRIPIPQYQPPVGKARLQ